MYIFNREKTYLEEFNKTSKRGYDKIGKAKYFFWFLIFLITILLVYIPSIIGGVIVGFVTLIFMVFSGGLQNMEAILNSYWFEWFNLIFNTGFAIFIMFLYVRLIEKRKFRSIGLVKKGMPKKYLIGMGVGTIMQLAYVLVILIFGWGEILKDPVNASFAFGPSAIIYVIPLLLAFMVQGASEEVMLRGWTLPVLARHYKVTTAIIFSSILFGLLHGLNPNVSLLSIVNIVLFGIFSSLYAINDGGLWGAFAHHSLWNWVMGNVFGLPVSGMIMGKTSIIEIKLNGPEWITGGEFGPEGGIIVTIIVLAGIIILGKKLLDKGIIVKKTELAKDKEIAL